MARRSHEPKSKPEHEPKPEHERRAWQASDWLDSKLLPILGPPPLGPYGEPQEVDLLDAICPLCGRPMRDHVIERTEHHVYLHCPGDERQVEETGRPA
ncbi:hypothetical protein [Leifsonia sp. NPDC058248]|uniref:hypothetical protein n=1 Tax=Leifsonia sp. NPDC058248 TaxID=3346402 RepID=UPI0036DD9C02